MLFNLHVPEISTSSFSDANNFAEIIYMWLIILNLYVIIVTVLCGGELMDHFSVLNYQGSKKNLLDFIHQNAASYIEPNSTILDIFAGTCSVGYSYKKENTVYANDSELYSYVISTALLGIYQDDSVRILKHVDDYFYYNMSKFSDATAEHQIEEKELLSDLDNSSALIDFYEKLPTVWNNQISFNKAHNNFELFTTYYSNSYFGLNQSMEIDSIRYAVEQFKSTSLFFPLLTSLFFAMKECVFSKDGHMAQPLNFKDNIFKLFLLRNKSIYCIFKEKFQSFFSDEFVKSSKSNKTYNMNFEDLIKQDDIKNNVSFIYADPPYTDMQYSRYYHLLNIVAKYDYPAPTKNSGKYTKGLYTENRYKSKLSAKSTCLNTFNNLISFSKAYNKNLAISFAYPADITKQKTDRYVMSIDDIKTTCSKEFGTKNVEIATLNYSHSNNRNKTPKKVIEYLVLCNGR